jgi:hypothetical protein
MPYVPGISWNMQIQFLFKAHLGTFYGVSFVYTRKKRQHHNSPHASINQSDLHYHTLNISRHFYRFPKYMSGFISFMIVPKPLILLLTDTVSILLLEFRSSFQITS